MAEVISKTRFARCYAADMWEYERRKDVESFLSSTFGAPSKETGDWDEEYEYDTIAIFVTHSADILLRLRYSWLQ